MSQIESAISRAYAAVRDQGLRIEPSRWQSMDVSRRAEATTYEVLNHTLKFAVHTEDVAALAEEIQPNLPWADDHFLERVGGVPLNPGAEWAHWPWGNSANNFRSEPVVGQGQGFSHTYMERMWPKYANTDRWRGGPPGPGDDGRPSGALRGVRYRYGDVGDVVHHLSKHPDSRQAFLPIWFPEDTGKTDVRVPCTLGYHFIHRRGFLHCTYYIRSCDVYRHLRDDVYLTVRLQLWLLNRLRRLDDPEEYVAWQELQMQRPAADRVAWRNRWLDVKPGLFTMHVVSLHCFVNDCLKLWPGWTPR